MHELSHHACFLNDWPAHTFDPAGATAMGDDTRCIRFADTQFCFEGLDGALAEAFDSHYAGLQNDGAGSKADVTLRYCRPAGDVFATPDTAGWQYDLTLSFDDRSVVMCGMNYLMHWKREASRASVLVGPRLSDPLDVLENPFRLACAYRLLSTGGVMLHSAGFASGAQAAVCWGRSGAGKSTLSGLVQQAGMQVLSDELNALLPGANHTRVQAMPFAGDLGRSNAPLQAYELKGLFFLQQAAAPSLSALGDGRALGTMSAAAPFVNTDPIVHERLFDALGGLLSGYSAKVLAFPKSPEAAHFVRTAIFDEPS